MTHITAAVKAITPLNPFVSEVVLQPEQTVDYKPGQYLQVVMGAEDKRPFSIANAPTENQQLQLHIGASEQNPYAMEVMQRLQQNPTIEIEAGCGEAYYRDTHHPVILLAGGTGYSFTRAILQHIVKQPDMPKVSLYWGAKQLDDLYEHEQLIALAKEHDNFSYHPVLEDGDNSWQFATGLVHEAVLANNPVFTDQRVYVAGRFEMARVVKQQFIKKGLKQTQLFGDAFAFID
ncbi:MAG: NAD(P)H-flavin reductase [Aestuariibacter sp.]